MGWEQLKAIMQSARIIAVEQAQEPPQACPNDGTLLDVRDDGTRNCPMGDYRYRG